MVRCRVKFYLFIFIFIYFSGRHDNVGALNLSIFIEICSLDSVQLPDALPRPFMMKRFEGSPSFAMMLLAVASIDPILRARVFRLPPAFNRKCCLKCTEDQNR